MAKKQKSKWNCKMCEIPLQSGAVFCSKTCEDRHYIYVEITMPKLWIYKTIAKAIPSKRYSLALSFSKRHKLDIMLVLLKLKRVHKIEIEA